MKAIIIIAVVLAAMLGLKELLDRAGFHKASVVVESICVLGALLMGGIVPIA